jgi:2-dehydro-3-deoxyglucarate aldolase/4-hydroxy-2-oxoheptanedioate aldolase
MRENKVKHKLRAGGTALGTMVMEFNTTGIARLAAEAGAEFVMFDMEHTGWSVETIRTLLATSRAADLVPMVRVPVTQSHFVARVLDMGAMGIMVPMVESEEQARQIVQFAKYPPQGRRGTAFGVSHDDYQDGDVGSKMRSANQEVLLIALIESVPGLENLDRIAAVEGIDVLWMGHFDLTTSMGIPGEFSHPRFREALQRLPQACQRNGKAAAIMVANEEEGRTLHAAGYRCLSYSGDIWLYKSALRAGINALRASTSS